MLFFSEMWERFSFYGMRALLTLYMTLTLFADLQDPLRRDQAIGIYAAYGALDLQSFFTVGEDECRAWTVRRGALAPEAAGVIHSDMERGFIRAEVIKWQDLIERGSEAKCREAGLARVEGKDYIMQDGDVVHFRFNV